METTLRINDILLNAAGSTEAIQKVYALAKHINPRLSLQQICMRSGIPSKGNLADVIKGRRMLKVNYGNRLAKAIGLNRLQSQYFCALLARDRSKDLAQLNSINEKIFRLRKSLLNAVRPIPVSELSPLLLLKVFCLIGLFDEPPNELQIIKKMAGDCDQKVKIALKTLISLGCIAQENDRYSYTQTQLNFGGTENVSMQLQLVCEALDSARENLTRWYGRPDVSFFNSTYITVKKADYARTLQKFRDIWEEFQTEVESSPSDELIFFNVQIFPETFLKHQKIYDSGL